MTSYIRVEWVHSLRDEPRILYSALDDERWETRKVEEFPDGHLGFADAKRHSLTTRLGEVPVPSLAEIAEDPQFRPVEITPSEFEAIWQRATQQT